MTSSTSHPVTPAHSRSRVARPRSAAASLLGATCAGCGAGGAALCVRCSSQLRAAPPGGVTAAITYRGVGRDAVTALKYRNQRRLAALLGGELARRLVGGSGLVGVAARHRRGRALADVVTWAPTSARRRRDRGFDQAELIAKALARELGLPCRRLLHRTHGGPQTGAGRAERLDGPVFVARPTRRARRVLVVDDVVTTGATLSAAARALRVAGSTHVVLTAAASTPPRSGESGSSSARPFAPAATRPRSPLVPAA